ncbi:MAG: GNAT family N-acetyltransferase [Alphaproteobacteria bacterium]|nr:GNAT family N-acetyltransferase [Alphaproteobacteria bacterium]
MDIIDINTTNVHTAWRMFELLCQEQGTSHYISTDVEKFTHALCLPDAILRGIMAREGGTYLGLVLYYFGASPYSASPFLSFKGLYVDPHHRHSGIGKALMQRLHMIASEKRCSHIQWNVVKENVGAISYYKHLGFDADPDPLLDYMTSLDDFAKALHHPKGI